MFLKVYLALLINNSEAGVISFVLFLAILSLDVLYEIVLIKKSVLSMRIICKCLIVFISETNMPTPILSKEYLIEKKTAF